MSHQNATSRDDTRVQLLDAKRLRSELSVYIWSQTLNWRSEQTAGGASASAIKDFETHKKSLLDSIAKLAGTTTTTGKLVSEVKALIANEESEALSTLDPATIASKISFRARA